MIVRTIKDKLTRNGKWVSVLLLLAFTIDIQRLSAQNPETQAGADEVWMSEPALDLNAVPKPVHMLKTASGTPNTISQLPFFDSFATESKRLDSTLWFNYLTVFRHRFSAISPPDIGTAVFDGANQVNQPYLTISRADYADSLESHYIDLSGFSPSDSLYLSFSFQCGGKLLQPGEGDSLVLYFRSKTDSNYVQVWATPGNINPSRFFRAMIPIKNQQWFHSQFQIKFRNIANLAGSYDHWHLDYVLLDRNRSALDTSFDDSGIISVQGSVFKPFTALPKLQYDAIASPMTPFTVDVRHMQGQSQTRLFDVYVEDGVSQQPLNSPAIQNIILSPSSSQTLSYGALSRENFNNKAASYKLTFQLAQMGYDANRANDTVSLEFRVDSLLAYDDGEAEAGYGLNSGRGFGQRIELQVPDTLKAVWMSFVPSIYNFERRGFFLTVWNAESRDSIRYQDLNAKISYGGAPNVYIRYPIWPAIPLGQVSYVGLIQTDNRSINIGYDNDYNSPTPRIYRDSAGVWRPSRLTGALMIRPELASGKFDLSAIPIDAQAVSLTVYPNPATTAQLNIALPTGMYTNVRIQVLDLQGREVLAAYAPELSQALRFELPDHLANGLYVVQMWAKQSSGTWVQGTAKWLLTR